MNYFPLSSFLQRCLPKSSQRILRYQLTLILHKEEESLLFLSSPGFRPSFPNATRDIETIGLLYSVRNEGVENIVRLHDCYSRTVMIVQPDCTTLTVRLYFAGCKKNQCNSVL